MKEVDSNLYQQEIRIPEDALKIQSNFKLLLIGASGQGKTQWIVSLLEAKKNLMVDEYEEVIYCIPKCCGHLTSVKSTIEKLKSILNNVTIYEGLLLDIEAIFKPQTEDSHCLIIYDDMYTDIINSKQFCHLATFGSRHHNCSIIVTSQNLFESGRFALSVRRQFQYYVLFFPTSEKQILITLGRNLFPGNSYCLYNCFKKLIPHTSKSFEQYLFIDVNHRSPLPFGMRIRSNVFSEEPYFFQAAS